MSKAERVLVVDDQASVREALRLFLKSQGYAYELAASPEQATELARARNFDIALVDLNYMSDTTSGTEGMALLERLREVDGELALVAMTAWSSTGTVVEAMRRGASDFVEKPWDNQRLASVLANQSAIVRARRAQVRLAAENALLRKDTHDELIAASSSMRRVLEVANRIASSDANILILGENGVGKGALARFIHQRSARNSQPFIKVDMGSLTETIFEDELFGHVRGAFTDAKESRLGRLELADRGTLFLDEIANTPLAKQTKLLRVLEDREFERVGATRTTKVNVRLICATNANITEEVLQGRFRRDLLFRINTLEIIIPPLRDRVDDIVPLAKQILETMRQRYAKPDAQLTEQAVQALLAYPWPGNIRELAHMVERAVLLSRGSSIGAEDLHLSDSGLTIPTNTAATTMRDSEEKLIRCALERHNGNVQKAADELGLTRASLYRRLTKFRISSERDRH